MKLCIPIREDRGLQSEINPHFGSAAYFLVVDTESGENRSISNHVHDNGKGGGCRPAEALAEEAINGVVVGGIGRGALLNLQAAGIQAFLSGNRTAGEALADYKAGALVAAAAEQCCGGHQEEGHSGGHCH